MTEQERLAAHQQSRGIWGGHPSPAEPDRRRLQTHQLSPSTDASQETQLLRLNCDASKHVSTGQCKFLQFPTPGVVYNPFRVVRRKDTTARLSILDVQSTTSSVAAWVVDQILQLTRITKVRTEYAECNDLVFVQRFKFDTKMNAFRQGKTEGLQTVTKQFYEQDKMLKLGF